MWLVKLIVSFAFLYLGGWSLVWGEPSIYFGRPNIIDSLVFHHGAAIRFNDLFYGAAFNPRFFDSPVISWFLLTFGLGFIFTGILDFDKSEEEESSVEGNLHLNGQEKTQICNNCGYTIQNDDVKSDLHCPECGSLME